MDDDDDNNDTVGRCPRVEGRLLPSHGIAFGFPSITDDAGIVGLFGPNGAGKSTLLRTLAGDITRFDGTLHSPRRKDIAYLPDEPFLYPWLRVDQGAELFASRHEDFRHDAFESFLSSSAITPSSRVGDLSKGMGERLHLALIMSRKPRLYILDEPLAGADPLTRNHLLDLMERLRSPHAPLLLSTHLIGGMDRVFNEIILIAEGRLVTHTTVDSFRARGDGDLELAYARSLES